MTMSRPGSTVRLHYEDIIKQTDRAVLFQFDDEAEEVIWVPKSVMPYDDEFEPYMGSGTVRIEEWFVDKEGLDHHVT